MLEPLAPVEPVPRRSKRDRKDAPGDPGDPGGPGDPGDPGDAEGSNELEGDAERRLRCKACGTAVARPADVFAVGETAVGTFVNPSGVVHTVLTVRRTENLVLHGEARLEWSWFPGYAWRVAACGACGAHIGWRFEAVADAAPPRFWGLRRDALAGS